MISLILTAYVCVMLIISIISWLGSCLMALSEFALNFCKPIKKDTNSQQHEEITRLENEVQMLEDLLTSSKFELKQSQVKSRVLFEFKNIENQFLRERNCKIEFELQSHQERLTFADMSLFKSRELVRITNKEYSILREQMADLLESKLQCPQNHLNYGLYSIVELDEPCELVEFTNAEFNILREENHKLKSELQSLQEQLTIANADLAESRELVEFINTESNILRQENCELLRESELQRPEIASVEKPETKRDMEWFLGENARIIQNKNMGVNFV